MLSIQLGSLSSVVNKVKRSAVRISERISPDAAAVRSWAHRGLGIDSAEARIGRPSEGQSAMPRTEFPFPTVILAGFLALLTGCGALERSVDKLSGKEKALARAHELQQEQLRQQLLAFGDRYSAVVQGAADDILGLCDSVEIRKGTVLWKARAIPAMQSALLNSDPLVALIDGWTFCVQVVTYFEGDDRFGQWQPIAIDAARYTVSEMREIAAQVLSAEQLEMMEDEVNEFAQAYPMSGQFARRVRLPSMALAEETADFRNILNGLWPFQLTSIDAGAQAISEVAGVGEQFVRVARSTPERSRWELQLLLYDLEANPTLRRVVDSFTQFTESSDKIARSIEALPDQLTAQINELEASQPQFQATLDKTREAAAEIRGAMEQSNRLAASLQQTAAGLTTAGQAWGGTFGVIDGWVQGAEEDGPAQTSPVDDPVPASPEDDPAQTSPEGERGFDILEYEATARAVTEAGTELRALLADTRSLAGSDDVTRQVDHTLGQSEGSLKRVVDHVFWRAIQLLGAIVFVVVALRLLRRKVVG